MPKRLEVVSHLSDEEIEARYRASGSVKERAHWQVIRLVAQHWATSEVAQLVGYSPNWVRHLVGRYNEQGPQALGDQRGRAGGHNALLDATLREELSRVLEGEVPEELGGGLWDGVKVARWLSQRLGHSVHRQRGTEALRAVGYSLQEPRPRHVEADPQEQEAFKKSWQRA